MTTLTAKGLTSRSSPIMYTNGVCYWKPGTLTSNKHKQDYRCSITELHTTLARSGLGIPGAHYKDGTPDTLTPESRSRRGVS